MLTNHDIICIAPDSWWTIRRRRYHLMSRLARTCRVLYIAPFLSRREFTSTGSARSSSALSSVPITQVNGNLFVVSPVYPLPCHRLRAVAGLNEALAWKSLKQLAQKLRFHEPVLWIHNIPGVEKAIGCFEESLVCYDVFDKTSAYAPFTAQQSREAEERHVRLCEIADVVLAASEKLCEDCRRHTDRVYLVPNGVDNAMFNCALLTGAGVPADMLDIPRPIIAYVGAIYDKLDFRLLVQAARLHPDWSIVMIGPERVTEQRAQLAELKEQRNVHFLGEKLQAELPRYLGSVDVGLLPYRSAYQVPFASAPLKLLEYLAAGVPALATGFEPAQEFAGVVEVASGQEEFVRTIRHLLVEDSSNRIRRGIEITRANSWDLRVEQIMHILGNVPCSAPNKH